MPIKYNPEATNLINEYIDSMPEWSRDICIKLRNIIHKADPKMIENWQMGPHFYHNGIVCRFIAFKKYVALVFYQGSKLRDEKNYLIEDSQNIDFKKIHFSVVKDIKDKVLINLIREAVQINASGKANSIPKNNEPEIDTPADLQKEIDANALSEYFDMLAYAHRKEYITWVMEAKKEETRKIRIIKTVEILNKKAKLPS